MADLNRNAIHSAPISTAELGLALRSGVWPLKLWRVVKVHGGTSTSHNLGFGSIDILRRQLPKDHHMGAYLCTTRSRLQIRGVKKAAGAGKSTPLCPLSWLLSLAGHNNTFDDLLPQTKPT